MTCVKEPSPSPPPPPSPKFRTLLPNEKIDFEAFRSGVALLEDQCERLMGSLEESRRIIGALTKEKDHYKEFWQVTNNYHSVMSRFQVPAPTAAVTSGSFPSQIAYSTSLTPLKMTAPPIPRPGYPAFTAPDSQSQQADHPQSKPTQEIAIKPVQEPTQQPVVAPPIPEVMSQAIPSTPEAAAAVNIQSPETPSKRTIMSYFTTVNKSVVSPAPAKETPAVVLNAAENPPPPPTPSHDGLAPTDHDPDSRPESPPLETPSKSQGNMSSTTPEEVVASPHGNGSGDSEQAKWFDQFIS
jgi:hypothetical protein